MAHPHSQHPHSTLQVPISGRCSHSPSLSPSLSSPVTLPSCSRNLPGKPPAQGLCTCWSLCHTHPGQAPPEEGSPIPLSLSQHLVLFLCGIWHHLILVFFLVLWKVTPLDERLRVSHPMCPGALKVPRP